MTNCIRVLFILLAVFLLVAGCKSEDIGDEAEVVMTPPAALDDEAQITLEEFRFTSENFPRMDGSPGTVPLAQALASVMLGIPRSEAEDLTMFTATSQAYRNLAAGNCEIIIAGEPSPRTQGDLAAQGFEYDMVPVASDALVFIVSKSNPVSNLTSAQVKAIYSGTLTGWQDVGGDDLDIVAFQRNEEALSQVLMEKLVMDWDAMADAPMQSVRPRYPMSVYGDDSALSAIKGFDGSLNAIGYTMYYYAASMKAADEYKILSIDGITPAPDTIAGGDYPFTGNYYAAVRRGLPQDDSANILQNWLLSDDGQAFIASEGYVPVRGPGSSSDDIPAPQLRWSVVTDSSALASFDFPKAKSARLRESALPSLEPSDTYGHLLPYSTAVTMNDGSIHAVKYGLVAEKSGIVVTDPVYDGIYRAVYSSPMSDIDSTALPAYSLYMNQAGEGDSPDFSSAAAWAACAADGSWITSFSYESIVYRENVIFMVYSEGTFDIDVYDYSGNLLYNILDLEWAERISENAWPEYMMYSENEALAFIQLDDGIYAMVDVKTGGITETDFTDANGFSDSLACVAPAGMDGLWGFVDKNLEFVIAPAYTGPAAFSNGYAVVQAPDGQHVINKHGEVLYTAPEGYTLIAYLDGEGYALYPQSFEGITVSNPIFLTYNFYEVPYPPSAMPFDAETLIGYLNCGWFYVMNENGIWIFNAERFYPLPASFQQITAHFPGFIIYSVYDSAAESSLTGLMSLNDNAVIIAPSAGQAVSFATGLQADALAGVMINTDTSGGDSFGSVREVYTQAMYSLYNPYEIDPFDITSAKKTAHGPGILSFDEPSELFYVQGTDYFAWLDGNGEILISIPSMGYTID